MSATDPIQRLQEVGVPVDRLSPQQREALASLSPQELDTLISIQQRLGQQADVQGFRASDDVGLLVF